MRRSMRRKTKPRPRRVTKTNRATNRSLKPRAKRSHQPREGVQHSDPKTLGMWFISRSVWSQRSWVCIAGNLWWMSRGRTCNGPRCYVCYVAVLMSPCVSIDVKSSSGTSIFLAWPINYMMILFSRCILFIQHMFLDWNLRILNLFFGNGVYMLSNTVCHGLERESRRGEKNTWSMPWMNASSDGSPYPHCRKQPNQCSARRWSSSPSDCRRHWWRSSALITPGFGVAGMTNVRLMRAIFYRHLS